MDISVQTYTRTAKILHWLVALFILTNVAIGLRMEHFPGYAHRVAGDHPVDFFGLWNWPSLFSPDEPLRVLFGTIHVNLAFGLGGLLFLHFGAVLKHLVIDRDGVARRMM